MHKKNKIILLLGRCPGMQLSDANTAENFNGHVTSTEIFWHQNWLIQFLVPEIEFVQSMSFKFLLLNIILPDSQQTISYAT